MPRHIISPKIITDPLYGSFDIRPVLPMIDTRQFQALNFKYQLGMAYLVFPSATHTRRAHCLGAYAGTVRLVERWRELDFITKEQGIALCAFALYHDIGHTPFSHVTEALCPLDNDGLGLQLIDELRNEIESCDVDFDFFKELFTHKNPLYLAVHDKNLGMEKLDYLERDGLYTLMGRLENIEYLRAHIYFIDNQIMIDQKAIDNAKSVQDFYIKMYKNVYLRKTCVIAQRMMQKMVYGLLVGGELTVDELIHLNDFNLLSKLSVSKSSLVHYLFNALMARKIFKETIVIRHKDFIMTEEEHDSHKSTRVFGAGTKIMNKFINSPKFKDKSQGTLYTIEENIAALANLPPFSVLVIPIFSPERFTPKDIKIYDSKETLKKMYPAHYRAMEELGRAYLTVRICTMPEYREKLSAPRTAQRIYDYLLSVA